MYIEFAARQRDARIANPPDAPSFRFCVRCVSPPRSLPSPSPFPTISRPLPPSTSCIRPCSSLFPSCLTYNPRHTPEHLDPTEGTEGEYISALVIGVASLYPPAAVPGYSERRWQRCERHERWAAVVRASAAAISTANMPVSLRMRGRRTGFRGGLPSIGPALGA